MTPHQFVYSRATSLERRHRLLHQGRNVRRERRRGRRYRAFRRHHQRFLRARRARASVAHERRRQRASLVRFPIARRLPRRCARAGLVPSRHRAFEGTARVFHGTIRRLVASVRSRASSRAEKCRFACIFLFPSRVDANARATSRRCTTECDFVCDRNTMRAKSHRPLNRRRPAIRRRRRRRRRGVR